jgi:hypothetical protein
VSAELELNWHKSSYSSTNGSCVETATPGTGVWVRDSKDKDGPVLKFTDAEWDAFVKGVKAGEFNL